MNRMLVVVALCGAGVGAPGAPVPKEDAAARMLRVYGAKSDPSGDARFDMTGERLWIGVPARPQPPVLDGDAPRDPERLRAVLAARSANPGPAAGAGLWREVGGEFTAVVRVSFPVPSKATLNFEKPARAAGLVAWVDEGNHAGLARVEEPTKAAVREAFHLTYTHSLGVRTTSRAPDDSADGAYLRLSRRNDVIATAYSRDGKKWHTLSTDEVEWPGVVQVGVYVKNFSDAQLDVGFDEYTVTGPKK